MIRMLLTAGMIGGLQAAPVVVDDAKLAQQVQDGLGGIVLVEEGEGENAHG